MLNGLSAVLLGVGFALLAWSMLRGIGTIISNQEEIMAAIDEAAAANAANVDALEAKGNEIIVTLQELKALVGTGNTANAEAILAQTNEKLGTLLTNLGAAETDADPTPDV